MLLSPHFDLMEFLTSQTAARMGRNLYPPPRNVVENLERLCHQILEPLRAMVERPIVITSGYRPDWLNAAVHGSIGSAHEEGRAADIIVPGIVPLGVASRVGMMHATRTNASFGADREVRMLPSLDQCILEFHQWTHVSIAANGVTPRGEFWTARHHPSGVIYEVGLRP